MPLKNQRLLIAAQGYCEMGMFMDANEELEQIDAEVRHLPEILAVRVLIYQGLEKWALMQVVAKKLAQDEPKNAQWWISWGYATRRAESIEAARKILLDALELHPNQAMFHYNIACYECQLGDVESAKRYLTEAIRLNYELRMAALEDEDLEGCGSRYRA